MSEREATEVAEAGVSDGAAAEPVAPVEGAPLPLAPTAPTIGRIKRLAGGPGMRASLARAAVGGLGNAAVGNVLARSALSDELRDVRLKSGKGALFARLRALTVSDPDVLAMVNADLSGDDLWLAVNLVNYGPEPNWPIHLKVEREMKGWGDSGGKGAVFNLLRAAGAQPGNADLTASIARVFPAATDDYWLAHNLQQYGAEASWPIHLRVEREMKGWGDSGGKGAVFELLRGAGAQPGNADLTASIARIFPAGTDDFWLASNLQQYGRETAWPIHLRVEREMKGWADSGGKGAVFNLLRAGAQPGNADLTAVLARIFPAGTEDSILANLLQRYGAEGSWPAPVNQYQCPFDFAPQSSPGERILYNGRYLMVPDAIPHYHELVATGTNGTFDSAGGPTEKVFRTGTDVNRIDTGNFSFFIPSAFSGTATASVRIELKIRSTGAVVNTHTWNFTPRTTAPTEVNQVESDAEIAIGSSYTYKVGPALPTGTIPFYEHQTVLEEFSPRTSNLELSDMDKGWLVSNFIFTKAGIDAALFGGGSNNGTFVVDNQDQYYDQHGGGEAELDAAASHLAAPKDVWVDLPQVYTAGPGNVLGRFMIRRIRHAAGGYGLKKWKL